MHRAQIRFDLIGNRGVPGPIRHVELIGADAGIAAPECRFRLGERRLVDVRDGNTHAFEGFLNVFIVPVDRFDP